MGLLGIVLILIIVFALLGGGYHGYSTGLFAGGGRPLYLGGGGIGLLLLILLIFLIFRGGF